MKQFTYEFWLFINIIHDTFNVGLLILRTMKPVN